MSERKDDVDRSTQEYAVDNVVKKPSFPNTSDSKYPQDEKCHGDLAGGDRHDAERLRDPIDLDEQSLASCR